MGKRQVRIRRMNWNSEFYADMLNGNGFRIIEPSGVSIDGLKKKSMYGSMSPLYGTTYEDEQSFIERYRCSCGEFKGRQFEGETCPICHTKVEFKESNINITGWISIYPNVIINPYWYNILQSAIGNKVFTEIVTPKSKVDTDGRKSPIKMEDMETEPLSIYSFIGIKGFFEQYDEIIEYFKAKRKSKAHTFDILKWQKCAVFTSHIPVYSTMLRPQSITSDTFYFEGIDKLINTIFSLSEYLKSPMPIEEDNYLSRIQVKVNAMWDMNLDMINSKEGWIRDKLLGGSLNFTSRNVIVPDPSLKDNEIVLSYPAFRELFKYRIIYYLMRIGNITLSKAYSEWDKSATFDEKVYQVMCYILKEEKPRVIINRNPTLNYYSMLLMKIRNISQYPYDYTLSVPLSILKGLNADFDGDILNIIALINKPLVFMFRKFDPVMRMSISRDSDLLNDYFSITKGQLIDLYAFSFYDGEEGCNTEEVFPEEETEQKPGFNLVKDVPFINNHVELRMWLKPMYIIDDYMESVEMYDEFQKKIYNIIKGCFTIKECRNAMVKFKFHKTDEEVHQLSLRMFIINTILWYPFVELHGFDVLNGDYILDDYEKIPHIEDYINYKLISTLREYHVKTEKINYSISEVLFNLRQISIDFSIILGLDFSIPLFVNLYNKNDRIREIMECSFSKTDQPHEIEQKLDAYEKEFIHIVSSYKDNHLGIILRANTGIKHKQLTEFAIAEGLKPNLFGQTMPVPISNSTLIKGTDKPSTQYIDATAAVKSLVMNKKVMGNAGHFGKGTVMLARTVSMSKTVSDCGTRHLVRYEVTNKNVLKKLVGKYYRLTDDPNEDLQMVKITDTHLIGQTIYVRSAVTCALKHHVCAKCVGKTAVTNADIADGLSAFESEEITKVVNQNILSAKHLLSTISEVVRFNIEFEKFFIIAGGEITPFINGNMFVPNIEDYAIYVDPADISKVEEMDEDSLYNTVIENGRFYIRDLTGREPDITIQAEGEKEIYITEEAMSMLRKGNNLIKFSDLDDDMKLFEVTIMNNELTKPLYDLIHLLNRQNKDNIPETIDSISNKLLSLIIEAKIDASVIACELIINGLIRSEADIYSRPDFSKEKIEPYQILTIFKALEKNPSPLIGLSFQNIKRQLLSNDMFERRNETSYIDSLYQTSVPTRHLKEYAKYADMTNILDD